jgi:uncharacterized membrane protein
MNRRVNRIILASVFILAGLNHFRDPSFYLPLIPPYLPFPELLNTVSGLLEVSLGTLVLFKKYRKAAIWGLISLMILFVPAHVYMIQVGGCISDALCVPEWIAWVRLVVIQPLIIVWIWSAGK